MEKYSPDLIQVGDIICTHMIYRDVAPIVLAPKLYTALTGDAFFHTVLVIDYNGEKYVLNGNLCPIKEIRESYGDKDKLQDLIQKKNWFFSMEPLESFIEDTKQYGLAIQVVSTNQNLSLDREILERIRGNSQSILHCCYFVSKYLEYQGVVKNDTLLDDVIYYNPSNLKSFFGSPKYFRVD